MFSTNGQFIQLNYTIVNGAIQASIARISKNKYSPSSVNSNIFVLKIEYAADDNVSLLHENPRSPERSRNLESPKILKSF